MKSPTVTFVILLAVALLHYSYVDFRFRHRDGVLWFWLANPAPVINWISRVSVGIAALAGVATLFVGATRPMAYIITGFMLLHLATLIAIEVKEGR
jgi:hypothetical protein